jgi:propanol-preferring alcohol dehydrogenase
MRAMEVRGAGPLVAVERGVPEPGAGEILVRVGACGICRTDLHIVEGELPLVRTPLVPGHQVVGRVERVGPDVTGTRVGDRVGLAWLAWTCGTCRACTTGRENLCEQARFTGYHADGGYAELAVARADFAYVVPDGFADAEAAPLLCAGIIGYRALRLSGVRPAERLIMYGFGSSAHLTLQIAVARGVEVFVCTREPAHRALARSLGAAWAGAPGDRVPEPAEAAIIFAPAGELVPPALRSLAPGGTLALAGIYMTAIPPLDYADVYGERRIVTVTASTRDDGRELLAEAAQVPVRPTVTTFPLDRANAALQALKAGAFAGSGVLLPGGPGV